MRFALGLAFASVFAAAASAQDWATREVCTVDKPRVHEEVFAPASLDELEQLASSIPNSTGKFWQITSPTGATSHLWGTFHSADPLILAAIKDAQSKASDRSQEEMRKLTEGMGLPPDMKLPF
jgi:hypothetical protein